MNGLMDLVDFTSGMKLMIFIEKFNLRALHVTPGDLLSPLNSTASKYIGI